LSGFIQRADWQEEKRVPVIECADQVTADTEFEVKIRPGKQVARPNTHALAFCNIHGSGRAAESCNCPSS
jgi:superoxide reductase